MTYTRSKHQGRYQWHEVQDLVRELAQQLKQRHTVEHTESQSNDLQKKIQHSSRIRREEDLRTQHTHERTAPPIKHHQPSSKIDWTAFRTSWARRGQHDRSSPLDQHEKSIQEHSVSHRRNETISTEDQIVPPVGQMQPHSQTSSSQPNPWELLRDHFIQLREKRIALEKVQEADET